MGKTLTLNKNPDKRELTGGQSLSQLSDQIRDLKAQVPELIPIDSIPVMEEFQKLFPMKQQNRESIAESIRKRGFDQKKAILIGNFPDGRRSLIDGFTRTAGSSDAGKTDIYAWNQDFDSVEDAIDWALHEQIDRRNLSESELYEYVLRIDEKTGKGKRADGYSGKSSKRTADIAGTSPRKVEQIRTVENDASEEQKEAIRNGDKSVNQVYKEVREEAKARTHPPEKEKPERNWAVEIRGNSINLIRGEDEVPLVNFSAMAMLYNGAPEKKLLKVVEQYMEKVL